MQLTWRRSSWINTDQQNVRTTAGIGIICYLFWQLNTLFLLFSRAWRKGIQLLYLSASVTTIKRCQGTHFRCDLTLLFHIQESSRNPEPYFWDFLRLFLTFLKILMSHFLNENLSEAPFGAEMERSSKRESLSGIFFVEKINNSSLSYLWFRLKSCPFCWISLFHFLRFSILHQKCLFLLNFTHFSSLFEDFFSFHVGLCLPSELAGLNYWDGSAETLLNSRGESKMAENWQQSMRQQKLSACTAFSACFVTSCDLTENSKAKDAIRFCETK